LVWRFQSKTSTPQGDCKAVLCFAKGRVSTHNFDELKVGDIATLVDFVSHPSSGEEGCVLEVFNAIGESLTVIAVPLSTVGVLRSDEILTVRSLANAG